jgi:hypothetical protein
MRSNIYKVVLVGCLLTINWHSSPVLVNRIESGGLGSTTKGKEMRRQWGNHWKGISRLMIQKWIGGVYHNVQEVIRLEGGSEYKEGRAAFQRDFKGRRVVGKLSTHSFLSSGAEGMSIQSSPER